MSVLAGLTTVRTEMMAAPCKYQRPPSTKTRKHVCNRKEASALMTGKSWFYSVAAWSANVGFAHLV